MSVCVILLHSSCSLEGWKHKEVAVGSKMRKLRDNCQKTEILSLMCSMPEKAVYFYFKFSMMKEI